MKKPFAPHFELIMEVLDYIRKYQPADLKAFRCDTMAQDAILMRLQVIGDATDRRGSVWANRWLIPGPTHRSGKHHLSWLSGH